MPNSEEKKEEEKKEPTKKCRCATPNYQGSDLCLTCLFTKNVYFCTNCLEECDENGI